MKDQTKVGQRRRGIRLRKRWMVLVSPLLVLGGLIALAPDAPQQNQVAEDPVSMPEARREGEPFQYIPDDEVYALDLDPRRVRFGLLEGWDREQDAFEDIAALAYVSGPMYERHVDNGGREITVPLGDLKFGSRVWKGRNRTASRQRAFIGIRHSGAVDFSYGELTDAHIRTYDTFIGGLHSLYNDLEEPPESYRGLQHQHGPAHPLLPAADPYGDGPASGRPHGGADEPHGHPRADQRPPVAGGIWRPTCPTMPRRVV